MKHDHVYLLLALNQTMGVGLFSNNPFPQSYFKNKKIENRIQLICILVNQPKLDSI